ncbi:flavoprotein-like protein [Achaetomium macrosporum]|uniref:Flavoprotein-like protein n=1 Tax=Achaetomium macrosporum TaxID=79813 RepID=A0AAN7BZV4_9PEZI|nr:flavoprotein-like protein [Achaetomium macrosporum]
MGDLNNTAAGAAHLRPAADLAYKFRSFAAPACDDDPSVRSRYCPFLLRDGLSASGWVAKLELATAAKMVDTELLTHGKDRLRIPVLYGSLRERLLLAYEASRILFRLGYGLQHDHPKVRELRELSKWSDGHVWVSLERHRNLTAVFKNQIDRISLSTGSVRPTQGRTPAIAQVNGDSQSFKAVNSLRILGRWMRMFAIRNQSSIPKAWTHLTDADDPVDGGSRLKPSSNRDRLVDCMEELVKYTIVR